MVVVEFVVAKDGTVRDVYALFGTNQQLNDEAVRVVKSSPKWTPAELDGQKKNVKLSIPVLFEF
jgi:TonB family protein